MSFFVRIFAGSAAAVAVAVGPCLSVPAFAGGDGAVGAGSQVRGVAAQQQEGRYLIRYATGTDVASEARSLRAQGVQVRRTFSHALRAAAVTTTPAKAAALARSPRVEAVDTDGRVHVSDTQSGAPWGLDRLDQRTLPLSTGYTAPSQGAGVTAYVVDTGVLRDHVDFGGRVGQGWTAISDGLGSSDCNGHGTHVAGTIAGATHGVAKAAQVIPVRVLDCNGSGHMSDVVAGLDWVAAHHTAGVPAVVNLSLGGGANSTVDAALNAVVADGIVATVAAGNSAVDACNSSPARLPAAITVAATDSGDRQASFSNFGSCVDLYAPGVGITSSWHTSATATAKLSGTSMAAPHAAGAAAVLLSQNTTATPGEVNGRLIIDATSDTVSSVTPGTVNRLLFVSSGDATSAPVTAPSAPTRVAAEPRRRAARVVWTRGSNGGSPLTRQTVTVYSGGKKLRALAVSGAATAFTVPDLKAGVSYRFAVTARNVAGRSPQSAKSNAVKPLR